MDHAGDHPVPSGHRLNHTKQVPLLIHLPARPLPPSHSSHTPNYPRRMCHNPQIEFLAFPQGSRCIGRIANVLTVAAKLLALLYMEIPINFSSLHGFCMPKERIEHYLHVVRLQTIFFSYCTHLFGEYGTKSPKVHPLFTTLSGQIEASLFGSTKLLTLS
ncbi:hypothetical protein K438DRAFT_731002 [Mycena galopus ATCC 62051]|nr:hypothetical protein K438DRAFT_731002 [Mycena galopus ATCC 62051]